MAVEEVVSAPMDWTGLEIIKDAAFSYCSLRKAPHVSRMLTVLQKKTLSSSSDSVCEFKHF